MVTLTTCSRALRLPGSISSKEGVAHPDHPISFAAPNSIEINEILLPEGRGFAITFEAVRISLLRGRVSLSHAFHPARRSCFASRKKVARDFCVCSLNAAILASWLAANDPPVLPLHYPTTRQGKRTNAQVIFAQSLMSNAFCRVPHPTPTRQTRHLPVHRGPVGCCRVLSGRLPDTDCASPLASFPELMAIPRGTVGCRVHIRGE